MQLIFYSYMLIAVTVAIILLGACGSKMNWRECVYVGLLWPVFLIFALIAACRTK